MRLALTFLTILALAACNHVSPDDGKLTEDPPVVVEDNASKTVDGDTVAEDGEAQEEAKIVVINNDNPEISNTQDFGQTSENLSIEDDKALLKAQREKFKVIEPTALPSRKGSSANIVEFALKSTNKVGEKIYTRLNPLGANLAKRNCLKYRSDDDAQVAFLSAGGPKRDSRNLDPDGDGFACGWSPEPYRKLVN